MPADLDSTTTRGASLLEEVKRCPLCGEEKSRLFEQAEDAKRRLTYLICGHCGFVYQSPRTPQAQLTEFYAREYRLLRQDTEEPTEKDLQMQEARAVTTLNLVRPFLAQVGRHLDIGSSSGALLLRFRKQYDCESVGVEPGDAYREFSLHRGMRTYASLEELERAGEARFDLVSMMHVLEHLPDPLGWLRKLRTSAMTPDAFLLVEVPNLIEHECLELAHLSAFTQSTLREVVCQAGFRVLWTKSHGSFRSPILRLYITLLARAGPEARSPGKIRSRPLGIGLRRRLGKAKREFFTRRWPDWTWQSPEKVLRGAR